jgi:hypothetical protein
MSTGTPTTLTKYDPTLKQTRRVGGWLLEWHPSRPGLVWAIPEYLKTWKRSSSGVYYGEDSSPRMGWDLPIPPAYVRQVAPAFVIQCQTQHNERG